MAHPDTVKCIAALAAPVLLALASGGAAQTISDERLARMIAEIHASHIEANVPNAADFQPLMQRDLDAYFAKLRVRGATTEWKLLRDGPTQSGVAYPKYYLWVRVLSGGRVAMTGAVRVLAVDKRRFEVSDFLPADEIRANPERVGETFPSLLGDAIRERARAAAPR